MARAASHVALCIMAKAPVAGQVKTRLCPPLSACDAAELSRCFLLDKVAQVREVIRAEPVVAYAPEGAAAVFEALAPGFTLLPQRGGDLTARLLSVFDRLFADGREAAIIIDSDTPTLPVGFLEHAVSLVTSGEHDLVLGPSEDGGYYLIGLRRLHPELFEGMPWSTPAVLEETLRRAGALGLRTARLRPWYDVDTGVDLARLAAELVADPSGGARHTREFILGHLTGRTAEAQEGV
jgi:rSAM/selenodomain-associated transferase 1